MRIAFFGSPKFAKVILSVLIDGGFIPVVLVCNPDRPQGRKKIISAPLTKQLISGRGLSDEVLVLQPEKIDEVFLNEYKKANPDLALVAAYSKIIPDKVISVPRLGTIGVHPSLLPCLRGSSPIQSAILEGVGESGVSLYQMDEKMDHGPIFGSTVVSIKDFYYDEAEEVLAMAGANLLLSFLPKIFSREAASCVQNENEATYTRKFVTSDGFIEAAEIKRAVESGEGAVDIDKKVRAFQIEPGVWTISDGSFFSAEAGKRVKILRTFIGSDGRLNVKNFQVEGKLPVGGSE